MSVLQDQMKEMGNARQRVLQAMETAIDAFAELYAGAKALDVPTDDPKKFEQEKKRLMGEGKPVAKLWQAAQSAVATWQSQINGCLWALEVEKKEVELQKERLKNATKEAEAVNVDVKKWNDNLKALAKIPLVGWLPELRLKPKLLVLLPASAATLTKLVAGLMAAEAEINEAKNRAEDQTRPKLKQFIESCNTVQQWIYDVKLSAKTGKK